MRGNSNQQGECYCLPYESNLKKTYFDVTGQILLHHREKEREEKNEILQDKANEKAETWNEEGGKNMFFEGLYFET